MGNVLLQRVLLIYSSLLGHVTSTGCGMECSTWFWIVLLYSIFSYLDV